MNLNEITIINNSHDALQLLELLNDVKLASLKALNIINYEISIIRGIRNKCIEEQSKSVMLNQHLKRAKNLIKKLNSQKTFIKKEEVFCDPVCF